MQFTLKKTNREMVPYEELKPERHFDLVNDLNASSCLTVAQLLVMCVPELFAVADLPDFNLYQMYVCSITRDNSKTPDCPVFCSTGVASSHSSVLVFLCP